jgi:hypothetical protein
VPVTGLATPGSLTVGGFGVVKADSLHMRSKADTSGTSMTTLHKNDVVAIIGGPRSGGGYTWYQVIGPVRQWGTVDFAQIGGWVAASGSGSTYLAPRAAPYSTRVNAGISDYAVGDGSDRVVTPNGDGVDDRIRVAWTNDLSFDGMSLRVVASNGSLVGSRTLSQKAGSGRQTFDWDGTIGGAPVPAGSYVLQLVGTKGTTSYTAPSADPVSGDQLTTFGVAVAAEPPTSVYSFAATTSSPTRSGTIGYALVFGGSVTGLSLKDFTVGGTASGCVLGGLSGSGASYALSLTKCSSGNVTLTLKAGTVSDAVANTGPDAAVAAPTVTIDRTAPTTSTPLVGLRTDVTYGGTAAARLTWSGSDAGGAGIASYDVRRSVDGGSFSSLATGLASPALNVSLAGGHSYRYEVRARDRAGNVGPWRASATTRRLIRQDGNGYLRYSSGWHVQTSSAYSGGSVRYATRAGASVRLTFTGRSIGVVTTLAPNRGLVRLYLDGVYQATLDLGAPVAYRRLVWAHTWSSAGSHTIKLVVLGTAGRPRVDLDAFLVLR